MKDTPRWTKDWGLLALGAHMDTLYQLMQPHAEAFQAACGIDEVGTCCAALHVAAQVCSGYGVSATRHCFSLG